MAREATSPRLERPITRVVSKLTAQPTEKEERKGKKERASVSGGGDSRGEKAVPPHVET